MRQRERKREKERKSKKSGRRRSRKRGEREREREREREEKGFQSSSSPIDAGSLAALFSVKSSCFLLLGEGSETWKFELYFVFNSYFSKSFKNFFQFSLYFSIVKHREQKNSRTRVSYLPERGKNQSIWRSPFLSLSLSLSCEGFLIYSFETLKFKSDWINFKHFSYFLPPSLPPSLSFLSVFFYHFYFSRSTKKIGNSKKNTRRNLKNNRKWKSENGGEKQNKK